MEYGSEWASDNIVVGAFESELKKSLSQGASLLKIEHWTLKISRLRRYNI